MLNFASTNFYCKAKKNIEVMKLLKRAILNCCYQFITLNKI